MFLSFGAIFADAVFPVVFSFFNWISEAIALRLMKRGIPQDQRLPLQLPKEEKDIPGVLMSPQIIILARWIQLRNRVHLRLSVSLFLALIPGLFLVFIDSTPFIRWLVTGIVFMFNCPIIYTVRSQIRPETIMAEKMEKHPDRIFASDPERLKKTSELALLWNKQAHLLEKGDRKRGAFLICLGTAMVSLLAILFLYAKVLPREISPGIYQLGGLQYRLQEDGTAEITGHGFINEKLTIPERLWNARVTVIGEKAFDGCSELKKVSLPAGLQEIRDRAFAGCFHLSEIEFPDELQVIGDRAFEFCSDLETILLPLGLKRLDAYAFNETKIKLIDLPEGLEFLGTGALNSYALARVTIPDSLRTIEGNPFYDTGSRVPEIVVSPDHPALKLEDHMLLSRDGTLLLAGLDVDGTCIVPQGVQVITEYAFYNNQTLRHLTLPDSLRKMGERAFSHNEMLESVTFGDGLIYLPDGAFLSCASLRECALPDTLRDIGDYAFSGCIHLSAIPLPESIERIGYETFANCGELQEVVLSDNLKVLQYNSFIGCVSLQRIWLPANMPDFFRSSWNINNVIKYIGRDRIFVVQPDTWAVSFCMDNGFNYELQDD